MRLSRQASAPNRQPAPRSPTGNQPGAMTKARKPKEATTANGWLFGWDKRWGFLRFRRFPRSFAGFSLGAGSLEAQDFARPPPGRHSKGLYQILTSELCDGSVERRPPDMAVQLPVEVGERAPTNPNPRGRSGSAQPGSAHRGPSRSGRPTTRCSPRPRWQPVDAQPRPGRHPRPQRVGQREPRHVGLRPGGQDAPDSRSALRTPLIEANP